ncbi:MAG: hypothetical protein MK135_11795, partial [Polyangiaceae bacterium]|nr:hypothetical protein [Polyangiaceae bacterium]
WRARFMSLAFVISLSRLPRRLLAAALLLTLFAPSHALAWDAPVGMCGEDAESISAPPISRAPSDAVLKAVHQDEGTVSNRNDLSPDSDSCLGHLLLKRTSQSDEPGQENFRFPSQWAKAFVLEPTGSLVFENSAMISSSARSSQAPDALHGREHQLLIERPPASSLSHSHAA